MALIKNYSFMLYAVFLPRGNSCLISASSSFICNYLFATSFASSCASQHYTHRLRLGYLHSCMHMFIQTNNYKKSHCTRFGHCLHIYSMEKRQQLETNWSCGVHNISKRTLALHLRLLVKNFRYMYCVKMVVLAV